MAEWLAFLPSLHTQTIKLGLERVMRMVHSLNITFNCPVITVAGTNGKGSTVKALEAIYHQAGYKVASFTSPALFVFNEQIRINEEPLDDATLMHAFESVAKVPHYQELTPFEFQTIAALLIFSQNKPDVVILEVGLGGRLDAVNAIDADVSIITSISLDHTEYLGHTRDAIAREKAGIMRHGRPAVIGETDIPASIYQVAKEHGVPLYRQGIEFSFTLNGNTWDFHTHEHSLNALPIPSLALPNISNAVMAVMLLQTKLPVKDQAILQALQRVTLPGRIEVRHEPITQIFDVSHNPASVALLAQYLHEHPISGKTFAIFSMLADKDLTASINAIKTEISEWWIAALHDLRATSIDILSEHLSQQGAVYHVCISIKDAYQEALRQATTIDRIVVFGSFHTVKESLV